MTWRGDTKIEVIECEFPICISLICALAVANPVDTSISHHTIDDHKVLQICQPRHATKFVRTDFLT